MSDMEGQARALWARLWPDIDRHIRELLHPHHAEHEAFGKDEVRPFVERLKNVHIDAIADGDALVYDATNSVWTNGEAVGGGGKRQFGYQVPGALAVSLGGPTVPNIIGTTITFTTAIATVDTAPTGDDIECSLDVDGTTVSFVIAAGNKSSTKQTGLSVAWDADTLITGAIAQVGSTIAGSDLSMVLAE